MIFKNTLSSEEIRLLKCGVGFINANNGDLAITGSLGLKLTGINFGREAHDLDLAIVQSFFTAGNDPIESIVLGGGVYPDKKRKSYTGECGTFWKHEESGSLIDVFWFAVPEHEDYCILDFDESPIKVCYPHITVKGKIATANSRIEIATVNDNTRKQMSDLKKIMDMRLPAYSRKLDSIGYPPHIIRGLVKSLEESQALIKESGILNTDLDKIHKDNDCCSFDYDMPF